MVAYGCVAAASPEDVADQRGEGFGQDDGLATEPNRGLAGQRGGPRDGHAAFWGVEQFQRAAGARSYDRAMAFERITIDPGRMGGVPCIRDLRVTVLGQLAGGRTIEELLVDYPYLERADVLAALEYAAAVVSEREVPIARLA